MNRGIVLILVFIQCTRETHGFINWTKNLLGIVTCSHPHVTEESAAIENLRRALNKNLFGQHLAKKTVATGIAMHLKDKNPSKALVLSLHGWPGSGKTYTAQMVMESLYLNAGESQFVKFYQATYHFPDLEKVKVYRETLKADVKKALKECPRTLFIFDEVDKLPEGLLDVLHPFIRSGARLEEGVYTKQAIFLFLSNLGASKIRDITMKRLQEGRSRESLTMQDFEEVLGSEAFQEKGGLYQSQLIEKTLVDWYVPFLPLQQSHVKLCVERDAKVLMGKDLPSDVVEEIVSKLSYWPESEKVFSVTGCKRVETLIKFHIANVQYSHNEL